MGYVVLAVGAAGVLADGADEAREVAVTGAVTQMVSHGLLTARAVPARRAACSSGPGPTTSTATAGWPDPPRATPRSSPSRRSGRWGSRRCPGSSRSSRSSPAASPPCPSPRWPCSASCITAALFLRALQRVFTGPTAGLSVGFTDVTPREWVPVALLLAVSVLIGVLPRTLLDVIEPGAAVRRRPRGAVSRRDAVLTSWPCCPRLCCSWAGWSRSSAGRSPRGPGSGGWASWRLPPPWPAWSPASWPGPAAPGPPSPAPSPSTPRPGRPASP